ncbi:hypothetical protein KAT80_00360 [Candidatus Pacearchaeota archaeon]|nr:hypothetical protein [Candidatus Pacearchaeota archaeon]
MIKKEDIMFLNQLVKTLEKAELKLEEAYDKKDYEIFNNMKKLIMQIQKKISELLNNSRVRY